MAITNYWYVHLFTELAYHLQFVGFHQLQNVFLGSNVPMILRICFKSAHQDILSRYKLRRYVKMRKQHLGTYHQHTVGNMRSSSMNMYFVYSKNTTQCRTRSLPLCKRKRINENQKSSYKSVSQSFSVIWEENEALLGGGKDLIYRGQDCIMLILLNQNNLHIK